MKSLLKKTNKKSGSIVSYRVSVLEAKSTLLLSELNIAGSDQDSLLLVWDENEIIKQNFLLLLLQKEKAVVLYSLENCPRI